MNMSSRMKLLALGAAPVAALAAVGAFGIKRTVDSVMEPMNISSIKKNTADNLKASHDATDILKDISSKLTKEERRVDRDIHIPMPRRFY